MHDIQAKVELPYQVTYLPPRARTRDARVRLSAERQVSIATCSMTDAPVAFRIKHANGSECEGAPYEIRAFKKKLWWPVLNGNYGPVTMDGFLNGLAIGKYDAIQILDPSRLWYSGRCRTFEDHFRDRVGDRILENGIEKSFTEIQRGASVVMICGDVVHFAGGTPVFFAHCTYPSISLRAGNLSRERCPRLFGSHLQYKEHALREGYVFDLSHLPREIELMKSRGVKFDLAHHIECTGEAAPGNEALHLCADEAVRRLLGSSTEISAAYRDIISRKQSDLIPLDDCRHILSEATQRAWREKFGWRHVELALECASHIAARLALHAELNLAPEDDDALASLAMR
ncbi:hypothetical protein [Bradyrhizobium sp. S3.5.5]|uniref:hypothetical protein n=1 Tax=Bradyrhizobium sp. S3.5.5 TaxID=3156430 RepID=UPI003395BCD2